MRLLLRTVSRQRIRHWQVIPCTQWMDALDDQVRAAGNTDWENTDWRNPRPLSSSLIEGSGYHGLMTDRQRPAVLPRLVRRGLAGVRLTGAQTVAERLTARQRIRQAANAANGTTLIGLAVARAARTAITKGPRGLIIASGYTWRIPFAGAFTLGNVVICRITAEELEARPALLGHEEMHCSQYAWCLGLPFLPLYFLAAGWSQLRTGNPGSANFFERQAGLAAGGYVDTRTPGPAPKGAGGIEV